jgi:hypothetical protein
MPRAHYVNRLDSSVASFPGHAAKGATMKTNPEDDAAWETWRNEVAEELGIARENVRDEW